MPSKRLTDAQCRKLAKRVAKDRSWTKRLPAPAQKLAARTPKLVKCYLVAKAHRPGDHVLVNDPKAQKHVPMYQYFYIGTYSTNGFGRYRLLRDDGKEVSCGTIINIDKALRNHVPNDFDHRHNELLPEDHY